MNVHDHIDQLRDDGSGLATAIAEAGPEADVPACPDWVVRDLVHHVGRVHRWATAFVAGGVTQRGDVEFATVGGPLPEDEELVDWFVAGHRGLVDALTAAPADLECWSFLAAPSPLAFWARRQSHETAVHRIDAEQAARHVTASYSPAFAADGLDEFLTGFVPRLRSGRDEGQPPASASIRLICVDDSAQWLVTIGPERLTTVSEPDGAEHQAAADCTVRGRAEDLYLALWNRADTGTLQTEGATDMVGSFLDLVKI
jgi:uncharacterized protein (TIGR03083 family)